MTIVFVSRDSSNLDKGVLGGVVLPLRREICARFSSTYTKIGTIQRRLAWPLHKDDTQIREAFHIFICITDSLCYKAETNTPL